MWLKIFLSYGRLIDQNEFEHTTLQGLAEWTICMLDETLI